MIRTDTLWHVVVFCTCLAYAHSRGQKNYHGSHKVDLDRAPQNRFNERGFVRDKDHIKDHLDRKVKFDPESVSPKELDFHFFKIHDLNEDHYLDGLEILAAVTHAVDVQMANSDTQDPDGSRRKAVQQHLIGTVDRILEEDDKNKDGYLSFAEYASARQAAFVLKQAGTVAEEAKQDD